MVGRLQRKSLHLSLSLSQLPCPSAGGLLLLRHAAVRDLHSPSAVRGSRGGEGGRAGGREAASFS